MEIFIRPSIDLIKKCSQRGSNSRLRRCLEYIIRYKHRALPTELWERYDGYKIPTNFVPQLGIEPRTYRYYVMITKRVLYH